MLFATLPALWTHIECCSPGLTWLSALTAKGNGLFATNVHGSGASLCFVSFFLPSGVYKKPQSLNSHTDGPLVGFRISAQDDMTGNILLEQASVRQRAVWTRRHTSREHQQ